MTSQAQGQASPTAFGQHAEFAQGANAASSLEPSPVEAQVEPPEGSPSPPRDFASLSRQPSSFNTRLADKKKAGKSGSHLKKPSKTLDKDLRRPETRDVCPLTERALGPGYEDSLPPPARSVSDCGLRPNLLGCIILTHVVILLA